MNQFELISFQYHENIKEHYKNLSNMPGFVLLESTDQSYGRYDILSAYPYNRIRLTKDNLQDNTAINQLNRLLNLKSSSVDLPFQGGAIGYISYDFGLYMMGIDSLAPPAIDNIPLLDLGFYDWALIVDHLSKKVDLFAAHNHEDTTKILEIVKKNWNRTTSGENLFQVNPDFQPLISQTEYQNAFSTIKNALFSGRCYQVNYTQPFSSTYHGSTWGIYNRIKSKNPVPFSAYLRTQDLDILSFSPERFLLYDQGKLLTSPIKGTMRRSTLAKEDEILKDILSKSEKNRAENVMIVDLLRNDLGKISKPGSVRVEHLCSVQSYPFVHHLVTDIMGECHHDISPLEAFLACFPGGSITGAPKLEAMKLINEQEKYSRGIYCGCIGYFSNHGRFDTNIAIRTLVAKDNVLHLASGGGIVMDSECEDEYNESITKITAIINGLT